MITKDQLENEFKDMCANFGYHGTITWRDNTNETRKQVIDYCKLHPEELHHWITHQDQDKCYG